MGQHLAEIKCECLYDTIILDTYVFYYNGIGIKLQYIGEVKRFGLLKFSCLHG